MPTDVASPLRSSTEPSESSPASISGSSEPTELPRTAVTVSITCERRASFCSSDTEVDTAAAFFFGAFCTRLPVFERDVCFATALAGLACSNSLKMPGLLIFCRAVAHTNGLATPTCSSCMLAPPCAVARMNAAITDKPASGITIPMPTFSARAMVLGSFSAIPPPDHVPHCTLLPAIPWACRTTADASRAALAAV